MIFKNNDYSWERSTCPSMLLRKNVFKSTWEPLNSFQKQWLWLRGFTFSSIPLCEIVFEIHARPSMTFNYNDYSWERLIFSSVMLSCKCVRLRWTGGVVLSPRAPLALALLSRGLALLSRQEVPTQSHQLDPEGLGCASSHSTHSSHSSRGSHAWLNCGLWPNPPSWATTLLSSLGPQQDEKLGFRVLPRDMRPLSESQKQWL